MVALTPQLAWFGLFCGVAMFLKLLWYPIPFVGVPVSGSRSPFTSFYIRDYSLPYSAIATLAFPIRSSVLSSSRGAGWRGCLRFRVDAGGEASEATAQSPLACSAALISMEPDDSLLAFVEISLFLSSPCTSERSIPGICVVHEP